MRGFVVDQLGGIKGKITILLALGVPLSHAMELVVQESVSRTLLKSTNCFGKGFSFPFVDDENYYEIIKNNAYSYPFDWATPYTTLQNNELLWNVAKKTGFLEVSRRTPLEESSPEDDLLWDEQATFLANMNFEKLGYFWPGMKIERDEKGVTFSHSTYKSYIFHSKEFKTDKAPIPCLTGPFQINDTFRVGNFEEPIKLYDYQKLRLRRYHYQFSFYHLYDECKENQYIMWVEAYNPQKPLNCVLDWIQIRNLQNPYYSSMVDVVKGMGIESKSQARINDLIVTMEEESEKAPQQSLEKKSLEEKSEKSNDSRSSISMLPMSLLMSSNGTDEESRTEVVIDIVEALSSSPGDTESKTGTRKRRSLSSYITRGKDKRVNSLDLQKLTGNSLSSPNSPTTIRPDYSTGLTPKSAPTSNRVKFSNSDATSESKSCDQKQYQEMLEDLMRVEKEAEQLKKQREEILLKLKAMQGSGEIPISASRSPSPGRGSPSRGNYREDISTLSPISNPNKTLTKRTKSADQYLSTRPWKSRSSNSRDKSVSPRSNEKSKVI